MKTAVARDVVETAARRRGLGVIGFTIFFG
jgi:hypothetical protein